MKEITLPTFLLAENPTEDHNKYVYIYSPVYMSLILIVAEYHQTVVLNDEMQRKPRKSFQYNDETFEFIVLQNNVIMTGGQLAPRISEIEFLDLAWEWWENYLRWEDDNIDENETSKLN